MKAFMASYTERKKCRARHFFRFVGVLPKHIQRYSGSEHNACGDTAQGIDSTHLTAVWCTSPYFTTSLADSETADAWKRRLFSQSGGPVLQDRWDCAPKSSILAISQKGVSPPGQSTILDRLLVYAPISGWLLPTSAPVPTAG